jgi:hypothetical protein
MSSYTEKLIELGACREALVWAEECEHGGMSLPEAMRASNRLDWIVWLAATIDVRRGIACVSACARAVQPADADPRSIAALELVDRWVRGEVVSGEALQSAVAAAWAARAGNAAARASATVARAALVADLSAALMADFAADAASWADAAAPTGADLLGVIDGVWPLEEIAAALIGGES